MILYQIENTVWLVSHVFQKSVSQAVSGYLSRYFSHIGNIFWLSFYYLCYPCVNFKVFG